MTNDQECPELLFRAHCRELLDRVAAGIDTRPATNAEKISLPVRAATRWHRWTPEAETLLLRLRSRMLPGIFDGIGNILDMEGVTRQSTGNQAGGGEHCSRASWPSGRAGWGPRPKIDVLLSTPHK